jgi:hypothetical protein
VTIICNHFKCTYCSRTISKMHSLFLCNNIADCHGKLLFVQYSMPFQFLTSVYLFALIRITEIGCRALTLNTMSASRILAEVNTSMGKFFIFQLFNLVIWSCLSNMPGSHVRLLGVQQFKCFEATLKIIMQ